MKQIIFKSRKILYILLLCISVFAKGNEQLESNDKMLGSATELVTKEESTAIEHVLEHMLMRTDEPSETLLRVCKVIAEGGHISIQDLSELLPSMIECMKDEQARVARPDAPGIGNGAISGCCGCCDFSQIIAILNAIKAKINILIACCDEIRFDFQATWSILANLNVTATVDLNPVFSVIDACCNGTFSTLANLSFTAVVDLNPVFTALNACCNSTFSMLDKIDREVIGTFSVINACCNGTFSAIADLKLSLTAIQVNFNPVFTALNACCESTFSMLDKIDREVIGTFSVINACCNGTFSTLANLSFTAVVDLNPVFTALNACCNSTFSMLDKIDREVIGTFSVINACCNGTFSVLANLTVTATADLSGVFTALNACCEGTFSSLTACCNGTFSAIADIKSSLTAITVNFNPVFTALNACCESTFSMLDKIDREVIGTFLLMRVAMARSACWRI
ncbi:hypothetical protein HYX58_05975 [Candidatus Dependentiae bacterium]|nr:hypothetical protein [Candidatus Dependentiae bacterium]